MKAVILSGGKGTRLSPYTMILPKPLVPIGHQPILDIIIRQLHYYGFTDVTLTLGYLAEIIQAYFCSVKDITSKLSLNFIRESKPLGTAGSLGLLKNKFNNSFLVMNGDILTSLNYSDLYKYHCEKKGMLTIATHTKKIQIDLGVIEIDEKNFVMNYIEKPEESFIVSMGVYVYRPEVLSFINENEYLDFPDLVLRLINNGEKVVCYPNESFWMDIGRPEDYVQA
ncbi:nucleoside-diphosphate-sugar pyrophosphorylase, partial [Candidatus Magnetomorum sp. HK-1]